MKIKFEKYHGTGNDFVMIDNRSSAFDKNLDTIKLLCDRHFGIGSDGLICIENATSADFKMDFYNPDGSQSFCGNGSRCAVAFAKKLGAFRSYGTFEAIDGVHKAEDKNDEFSIKMGYVKDIFKRGDDFFVDTGSPHFIRYTDNLEQQDLIGFGRHIRYSEQFEKSNGTNVNLVESINAFEINMRTYERGVEDETWSCGTGVTAAAVVHGMKNQTFNIDVHTKGGDLKVRFNKLGTTYNDVWLTGPAEFIYEGEIEI